MISPLSNRADSVNHPFGGDYMGGSVIYDKRSKRFYISIYWEGKRFRIFRHPVTNEPFFAKQSADKQLSRIRTEIDEGYFNPRSWFPDSPLSMSVYALRWLESIKDSISFSSYKNYRGFVNRHIVPYFKEKDIRRIRYSDIVSFNSFLTLSKKGKYNVVSCLKTMLRYAWKAEDISRVPPFPKLSFNLPEIKYLTFDQQNKVLSYIPVDDRPIFYFMQEYGVRPGEARALKKDCIESDTIVIKRAFSENTLIEQTKTGSVRLFEKTDFIITVFSCIKITLSPFVFVRSDGKPYTSKNLNKIWREACSEAGIEMKMYNAFRHSLGCQLLDCGVEIDVVRQQLGHTKIEMTRRYAKRSETKLTEALNLRRNNIVSIDRQQTVSNQKK